jgi:quercetin dioxygenase-like cupin family protein
MAKEAKMGEERFYCVQNVDKFEDIAMSFGFSKDKVVSSKEFPENAKRAFSAYALGQSEIIDAQFSDHMPEEETVEKFALPFVFCDGTALFQVTAKPGSVVKPHRHTKGFIRTITLGSITFTDLPSGNLTLGAGDWLYIPPGQMYGYKVGDEQYLGYCCYCTK